MSSKPPQPFGEDLADASTELRISTGFQDTIAVTPADPDNPFDEETVLEGEAGPTTARTRWARGSALAEPPAEQMRLGNYRVVTPLSAGRSGVLHLGEHALLRYRVAIKILPPSLRGEQELERRLLAEAVTMARVSHPGVPTVLDFGHDSSGSAFLVMEFIDGETLAAHLARGTRFSLPQIIEIGAQVAAALAACHVSGVVHRDIQPDSIHLCPAPGDPTGVRTRLVNFAMQVSAHESGRYMAPEQTWGPAAGDVRSDVYSLGCVLFELLTGVPPFVGSVDQMVTARQALEPPPPRAIRPDVPPALDQLVHRMIARRPEDRPAGMAEVEHALRASVAPPPRPASRISRPMLALCAGIAVGLALGYMLLNM
jgi:eukaryotic-like serine/threonine-protein kinase